MRWVPRTGYQAECSLLATMSLEMRGKEANSFPLLGRAVSLGCPKEPGPGSEINEGKQTHSQEQYTKFGWRDAPPYFRQKKNSESAWWSRVQEPGCASGPVVTS